MILNFKTYILEKFDPKRDLRGVLKETDRHRFRKLLKSNIVTFKFKKRDGSIRKAKGTLISKYLPALKGGSPRPEHQMVYFDMEKDHWRSFRSYSFIKILNIKSVAGTPTPKKHKEDEEEEETTKKTITKKEEKEEPKKKHHHTEEEHDEETKHTEEVEHEEPKEKKEVKKVIKKEKDEEEPEHKEEDIEPDDVKEDDDKKDKDEEKD